MSTNSKIAELSTKKSNSFLDRLSFDEKVSYFGLLVLILFVYIVRAKFEYIPFERDEGSYSYYGKLLLEGKIPYKDFYEQKFPGIFYFYAFMELLFGASVKGLHNGFMLLNIATMIVLFFASKKIFNPLAAVITAATFGFTSLTPVISGFTIQSEHGVAFFSALGILAYVFAHQTKRWYYYLLTGLAMGCAFMTKTTGVFLALWGGFVLIIDILFDKERNLKSILRSFGWYAFGGFFVIGLLFFIIYLKGSFAEMLFWSIDIPKYYVNRMPLEEGLKYFGYTKDAIFQFNKFLWLHAILGLIIIVIAPAFSWSRKIVLLSLGIASFLTIVPGYYFYGHYWLQLLPGLSILAGATFYGILNLFSVKLKLSSSYVPFIYIGLFSIILYAHIIKFKQYYFKPNYEQILRSTYGGNPFPESMEIAKYLNSVMKPNDEIVVIGSEPQVYIYTNKKSPTRHIFFSSLVTNLPQHVEWQREYVKDIEAAKPKYIIYYNVPISLLVQPNTDKYVFEWANKYINENYNIIGLVDMVPGQHATYAWKEQLNGFKPQAQEQIFIYERK